MQRWGSSPKALCPEPQTHSSNIGDGGFAADGLLYSLCSKTDAAQKQQARATQEALTRCCTMAGNEKTWPQGVICGATGGPSAMGHVTSPVVCMSTCAGSRDAADHVAHHG